MDINECNHYTMSQLGILLANVGQMDCPMQSHCPPKAVRIVSWNPICTILLTQSDVSVPSYIPPGTDRIVPIIPTVHQKSNMTRWDRGWGRHTGSILGQKRHIGSHLERIDT